MYPQKTVKGHHQENIYALKIENKIQKIDLTLYCQNFKQTIEAY